MFTRPGLRVFSLLRLKRPCNAPRVLLLVVLLLALLPNLGEAKETGRLTIRVKSSPDAAFESRLETLNKRFVKQIEKAPKQKTAASPELPYAYLTVHGDHQRDTEYVISYALNLFDLKQGVKVKLPQKEKERLRSAIQSLEEHHYGKPATWKEASKIFPRMGYADIVDIETGKSFRVQRRAGQQHADAQPLTAKDTKIMKEIYQGKWSWKRRAILVRSNGHTLAASMHGMPHGAGAIRHNQFPGHFCIHFKDSTTHRRNEPDPGHDFMISKASGELYDRLIQGSPESLTRLFFTAIFEQDKGALKWMLNQADSSSFSAFMTSVDRIEAIRWEPISAKPDASSPFLREIPIQLSIKKRGENEASLKVRVIFTRGSIAGRWKVEPGPLLKAL